MKIFSWNQILEGDFPEEWKKKGCALTVGSFDGIHLGHQALIKSVMDRENLLHGVVTFSSSCRAIDKNFSGQVYSLERKLDFICQMGLDFALVIDFSNDFAKMEGEDFIDILLDKCGLKFIAEGRDFRCGYKGSLNMDGLGLLAKEKGFLLEEVPDVLFRGERISSSRIRDAIGDDDLEVASEMLGRIYER